MILSERFKQLFHKKTPEQFENRSSSTNKLRIFLFSDFHGTVDQETLKHALLNQPSPDVVFTLGDISVSDLSFIKTVFSDVPVYGVRGNHDELTTLDMGGIPNIHGKVIEVAGVRFAGIGGSVGYKPGSYIMYSQKESLDIAKALPPAAVLISHDKAYKGKTSARFPEFAQDPHEGMAGISYYLRKHSPFLHIHGHIHTNTQYAFENTDTVSVYGAAFVTIAGSRVVDYCVLMDLFVSGSVEYSFRPELISKEQLEKLFNVT